ncbi:MAG: NUDIX domain-containing protein [Roseburia sp.]|nr:NUDIX domain-containing protein [Roseburia sp.]
MEIWDGYYEDGSLAGVDLIRGEALPQGLYHMVCEALVRHADGDYLLMQRDFAKETHPGEWEATAGGSALKGEDGPTCIRRELWEETGICAESFTQVGYEIYRERGTIFYCYLCMVDCDKTAVRLQAGETVAYKWMSEREFIEFVNSGEMIGSQRRRYQGFLERAGYLHKPPESGN